MSKFMQGRYKVRNPNKYKGNVNDVVYRSSWELSMFSKLDNDPQVIQWSSESIIIPYRDHAGNVRRYFVDLYVKRKIEDKISEQLIEIKPHKETIPPVLTEGKKTKTKIREVLTWDINQRKWAAARKYCQKMGWQFEIVTEKNLPGIGKTK